MTWTTVQRGVAAAAIALVTSISTALANQWTNYNEPLVNMQNVLDPSNHMYDAYGSWYDDGTGMKFHGTNTPPGQAHPTNPPGHGYIPSGSPLLYQYDTSFLDNAPSAALGIVNDAFSLWDSAVNGTQGTRSDDVNLGFDWRRAAIGETPQIIISWQDAAPASCGSVACVFSPNSPNYATPTLTLIFYTKVGSTLSNFDLDLGTIPPDPGPGLPSKWPHQYDLLSTALHELGHVAGLDDLYNLYGNYGGFTPMGFPGSTMGTSCRFGKDASGNCISDPNNLLNAWNPYNRTINLGSLQGVIDLYSVPEPSMFLLLLIGFFVSVIGNVSSRRCT